VNTVDRVKAAAAAAVAEAPMPTDPAALDARTLAIVRRRAAERGMTAEAFLREVAAAQAAKAQASAEAEAMARRIRGWR
jgi:hypothetical protein